MPYTDEMVATHDRYQLKVLLIVQCLHIAIIVLVLVATIVLALDNRIKEPTVTAVLQTILGFAGGVAVNRAAVRRADLRRSADVSGP